MLILFSLLSPNGGSSLVFSNTCLSFSHHFHKAITVIVSTQNLNMHLLQPLLLLTISLIITLASQLTPPPLPFATTKPLSAHHKYPTFPPAQVAALAGRIMAKPGWLAQLQLFLGNRCECRDGLRCCGSYCECDAGCGEEVKGWECLL
jgi:hypothetical protein